MSYEYSCEVCPGHPKNVSRVLIRCFGCAKPKHLCRSCASVWIACSEECKAKWREEAAKGIPKEKIVGPAFEKAKKKKGYDQYQQELA